MNPWPGSPAVPQFERAFPRLPGFSSLTSAAVSPGEHRLILTFVNYNQTPQCPFPAEPVQSYIDAYPKHAELIWTVLTGHVWGECEGFGLDSKDFLAFS